MRGEPSPYKILSDDPNARSGSVQPPKVAFAMTDANVDALAEAIAKRVVELLDERSKTPQTEDPYFQSRRNAPKPHLDFQP